ncbi:MAG: amidohydrolase family protein [Bacteroidota bacterium]
MTPFETFLTTNGSTFDYVITGGTIYDGTGETPYSGDILIRADTIAYIGNIDTQLINFQQHIDASGKIITPGFIDAHAHGNPFDTPQFENFLAMGVTTICLGQDGSSPNAALPDWMEKVAKQQLGTNIAMFVGHGTLRYQAGIGYTQNPSKAQLAKQQKLLSQALASGCFGMTTGLEYTPGTFADDSELLPLAQIVGQHNGLIMSHVRNEDDSDIETSINELLRQGQYCNVQVSHMKSVYGKGAQRGKDLLEILENTSTPYTVTADVYPYTASYTGIGIVFPKWAKPPNVYQEVVRNRREELLAFLKKKIEDRNGPEATLFGTAPYAGKTLAQLAEEQNLPYEKVLLGIGPNRASGAYFIMDEALQTTIIAHPKVMICSDGSPTMRHPRGYGSFAKIIETYVQERSNLSLTEAIRKMTHLPAQTIGIERRGLLKKGYFADLLIFNPTEIKATAAYENPHQLAEGFDFIFVNGQLVRTPTRPFGSAGRLLVKKKTST